jgi:hypothetical protein
MYRIGLILITLWCLTSLPFPAFAEDFDGSKPLLGSVLKIMEIYSNYNINEVDPETVSVPRFFIIDFKAKTLRPTKESRINRSSIIKRIEHIENILIQQGVEEGVEGVNDGLGWSMTISKETGKMVLTASADKKAFVVFGTTTPDNSN